jgi:hypothetical protein
MSDIHTYSSDVAFTPAVKAIQSRKGSRDAYARAEERGGWRTEIDEDLSAFLAGQDSMFLATATAHGQPYIQHRGGPKGFVKVLDKNTLAFADYSGNRQYITQGNLSENPRANIFLIDYAHRRRVKIWGEARVVDDDPALMKSLMPPGYRARPEQVILFRVAAWSAAIAARRDDPPAPQSAASRPRATPPVCGPRAQNPEGRPPRQRPAWRRSGPWHYFIYCNDQVSTRWIVQISRRPILVGWRSQALRPPALRRFFRCQISAAIPATSRSARR